MLKVAAYCRVSTNSKDQANSLESQKRYFDECIKRNPEWVLVRVYYDSGISGTSLKKRDQFNEMVRDALDGKINYILVKEVSRFARNTVDALVVARQLKAHNVNMYFLTDWLDTKTPDWEVRFTSLASYAQEESRKISERVTWGLTRRMEQGIALGSSPPYGYILEKGHLTVNEDEAAVVRLIFEKSVEGYGAYVISGILNKAGYPTRCGGPWSKGSVRGILNNDRYTGDLRQQKHYTVDYLAHKQKKNAGERPLIMVENTHEAIITRELWEKVQQSLIERRNREYGKVIPVKRWGSGKIKCGECGFNFAISQRPGLTSWRCMNNSQNGREKIYESGTKVGCANPVAVLRESTLLGAVRYALELIGSSEICRSAIAEVCEDMKKCGDVRDDSAIAAMAKKLQVLENRKDTLMDSLGDGLIMREEFVRQKQRIDIEINDIQTRLKEAENIGDSEKVKEQMSDFSAEIEEYLKSGEIDERICGSVLKEMVVSDGFLDVFFVSFLYGFRIKYKRYGRGRTYRDEFDYVGLVN